MEKMNQFYEEIINLLEWAEDHKFISADAQNLLIENLNKIKEEIESK